MEYNESITLSISGLALILSFIATVISLIRSKYERQRVIRSNLTDVLNQIVSVGLENIQLMRDASSDPLYAQSVSATLNQRNAFLLQQAIFLAEQIPDLVTGVEYNTIAAANENSGDIITAEIYHKKSIDSAKNSYYRTLAKRDYARFLFFQRRFEEARECYKQATTMLNGNEDIVLFTNGLTYQKWALNELYIAESLELSNKIFKRAMEEFNKIRNEMARNGAIAALKAAQSPNKSRFDESPRSNITST